MFSRSNVGKHISAKDIWWRFVTDCYLHQLMQKAPQTCVYSTIAALSINGISLMLSPMNLMNLNDNEKTRSSALAETRGNATAEN